jgi:hypothetical protein
MMTTQCQTVIFGHSIHRASFTVTHVTVHELITPRGWSVSLAITYAVVLTSCVSRLPLYFQQLIDQEQISEQRAKMN